MKIGIAFSGGGHYLEAMRACKLLLDNNKHTIFFLTYHQSRKVNTKRKTYYVTHPKHGFIARRIFLFLVNLIQSFIVYIREKPEVIISTGADVTLSIMWIAKIFGKKVVFIESGANVTKPSLTGRLIYRFADKFIIQWEELKEHYPNAIYGGSLL